MDKNNAILKTAILKQEIEKMPDAMDFISISTDHVHVCDCRLLGDVQQESGTGEYPIYLYAMRNGIKVFSMHKAKGYPDGFKLEPE